MIFAVAMYLMPLMVVAAESTPSTQESGLETPAAPVDSSVSKLWDVIVKVGDTDGNGTVSKEEAITIPWQELRNVQGYFARIDANRDGNIDQKEFTLYKSMAGVSRRDAFAAADADGSGGLSRDELEKIDHLKLQPLKENFDTIDTNHDGELTPQEWLLFIKATYRPNATADNPAEAKGPEPANSGTDTSEDTGLKGNH